MDSREIVLWVDERWYDALEKQLHGETLQDKMEELLDGLINKLVPENEYKRIDMEIHREREEQVAEREANRRFAVFKVTENGEQSCYLVDEPIDFLRAARSLRNHLRAQNPSTDYRHHYAAAREITPEEFAQHSITRAENPKRVTGTFEIDLDRGEFASLDAKDGWKLYKVKDVCAAAYHAERKQHAIIEEWEHRFAAHLDGKEISPTFGQQGMAMSPTM